MAYVNYLGLTEPNCTESITETHGSVSTFVSVDVACVPLNYFSQTFCGTYKVRVSSCEEFVSQQNQCYEVLEWQADEITVKKRANATLWEKKTNNCFEHQCLNSSGRVAWSLCNTTDDVHRMCIDNSCVEDTEAISKDKWGVEMDVSITPSEFDIENVTYILSNATGILEVEMLIGTEAIEKTGYIIRVVVLVNNEENAQAIVNVIESKGKGEECTYGVLCKAKTARIMNQEEEALVMSNTNNNHVDFGLLILTIVLMMMMTK